MKYLKQLHYSLLLVALLSCQKDEKNPENFTLLVPPVSLSKLKYLTSYNSTKPTLTYWCMDPQEKVLASCEAVVVNILLNENTEPLLVDYEIHLQPIGNSDWLIVLDHVKDIIVQKNQLVKAGQQIATVCYNAYVELQVNNNKEGKTYCPIMVGSDYFKQAHQQAVYYEDFNYYNEEKNEIDECTPTLMGELCEDLTGDN